MTKRAKTIWVIEDGEYSDYRVIGVFSSEANARAVQALLGGDGDVSEWPLDPAVAEINAGMSRWEVLMLRDGTTERVDRDTEVARYDLTGSHSLWRRSQLSWANGKPDCLKATVWASDATHAVKIANEIRARMIAEGEW